MLECKLDANKAFPRDEVGHAGHVNTCMQLKGWKYNIDLGPRVKSKYPPQNYGPACASIEENAENPECYEPA